MNIYRRACHACTASKRRCSKQIPACNRCAARGIDCRYPPTQSNDNNASEIIGEVSDEISPMIPTEPHLSVDSDFPILNTVDSSHEPFLDIMDDTNDLMIHPHDIWFVAWDSWNIEHQTIDQAPKYIGEDSLDAYVQIIRSWLQQWISSNSCPIIHQQLYRMQMPRCMQNAFMACAVYFSRTSSNKSTVFHIINDQAGDLIQQHTTQTLGVATLTLAEHLARVQALLIFQIIRLFDGDIRMRARAEMDNPVLASWNTEMWQLASRILPAADWSAVIPGSTDSSSTLWKAWCLSESIRRTWLTTSILQSVYTTIRDGISACPGGVFCTFGNELWDATSDFEWGMRTTSGKNLYFLQSMGIGQLLVDAAATEVDDFGHAFMLISQGLEKKQRWTMK